MAHRWMNGYRKSSPSSKYVTKKSTDSTNVYIYIPRHPHVTYIYLLPPLRWTWVTPSWPLNAVNPSTPGSPHPERKRQALWRQQRRKEPAHFSSHFTYSDLYIKVNQWMLQPKSNTACFMNGLQNHIHWYCCHCLIVCLLSE